MTHSFIHHVRLVIKTYVKTYFAFVLLELEKNYYHTFIHFPSLFLIFWKSFNTSFINNLPPNIKTYFAFSFITFARKAKFFCCVFFCLFVRPSVRPSVGLLKTYWTVCIIYLSQACLGSRNNPLDFGGDPDYDLDLGSGLRSGSHGFAWNFTIGVFRAKERSINFGYDPDYDSDYE